MKAFSIEYSTFSSPCELVIAKNGILKRKQTPVVSPMAKLSRTCEYKIGDDLGGERRQGAVGEIVHTLKVASGHDFPNCSIEHSSVQMCSAPGTMQIRQVAARPLKRTRNISAVHCFDPLRIESLCCEAT